MKKYNSLKSRDLCEIFGGNVWGRRDVIDSHYIQDRLKSEIGNKRSITTYYIRFFNIYIDLNIGTINFFVFKINKGNFIKKIVIWAYLFSHRFLKNLLKIKQIRADYNLILLFYPSKIKAINLKKNILKHILINDNTELIKREIHARTDFKEIPVPELYKYDENYLWFTEQLINLKEIRSFEKRSLKQFNEVFDSLLKLYNSQKEASVRNFLSTISGYWKYPINPHIFRYLDSISGNNNKIVITQTHGDFHLGNILIGKENNKGYLLDWEYSRECPVMSDIFHFFSMLYLRNKDRSLLYIFDRSIKIKRWKKSVIEKVLFNMGQVTKLDTNNRDTMLLYYCIYCLERISFVNKERFAFDKNHDIKRTSRLLNLMWAKYGKK